MLWSFVGPGVAAHGTATMPTQRERGARESLAPPQKTKDTMPSRRALQGAVLFHVLAERLRVFSTAGVLLHCLQSLPDSWRYRVGAALVCSADAWVGLASLLRELVNIDEETSKGRARSGASPPAPASARTMAVLRMIGGGWGDGDGAGLS